MHSALSCSRWAEGGGAPRHCVGWPGGQRHSEVPGGQQPRPHLHLDQGRL